jgi:hypothetical protein
MAQKKGEGWGQSLCYLSSFFPSAVLFGFRLCRREPESGEGSVPTGSLPSQAPGLVFPLSAEETRLDSERAEGSQITDRAKKRVREGKIKSFFQLE